MTGLAPLTVLAISGSLRHGSTNTALLRTALGLEIPGVNVVVFDGMNDLPHFNPDDDVEPLDPAVAHLRESIATADAVVFSTPEYAGALPGSFKNLLDWSVGAPDGIYEKPVAWINASSSPTGAANAHASLKIVLGYVGARIVDEACAHIAVPRGAVGADDLIADPAIHAALVQELFTLRDAVANPVP